MSPPPADLKSRADYQEMFEVRKRVAQIAAAMSFLYLAAAMFGLATLLSITGAVLSEVLGGPMIEWIIIGAACAGVVGFFGFVAAGIVLVIESRLALKSLVRESDEALAHLDSAVRAMP